MPADESENFEYLPVEVPASEKSCDEGEDVVLSLNDNDLNPQIKASSAPFALEKSQSEVLSNLRNGIYF